MCFDTPVKCAARWVFTALWAATLTACGEAKVPVDLFVASIDFVNDPALNNRYDYEISGHDFDDEHTLVQGRVFSVEGPQGWVLTHQGRRLIADFDEPAPHRRQTPMSLEVRWGQAPELQASKVVVAVQGELRSTTAPTMPALPVLSYDGEVDLNAPLTLVTQDLPSRVDLYTLVLSWQLSPADCVADCEPRTFETHHAIPTFLRDPRPEVPRYKRMMLWSASFGAGQWIDGPDPAETERAISMAMLEGFATLHEAEGKSYGAFPRPTYDGQVDGVDVWLDFPRSACGEFKFGLMALIEYQGIDAQWGVLEFLNPGSDHFSQYATYDVPALGRDSRVWYHTNHAFTVVNGEVFDPTYNGYAPSYAEYEDQLFAKFCYGQDEPCNTTADWCDDPPEDGVHCIDNPPGHDPELGMVFYSGDSYN